MYNDFSQSFIAIAFLRRGAFCEVQGRTDTCKAGQPKIKWGDESLQKKKAAITIGIEPLRCNLKLHHCLPSRETQNQLPFSFPKIIKVAVSIKISNFELHSCHDPITSTENSPYLAPLLALHSSEDDTGVS